VDETQEPSLNTEWGARGVTINAGLISQLAGLLAGFAFTVITLLLSSHLEAKGVPPPQISPALPYLLAVFFQMALASYLYASLAAEMRDKVNENRVLELGGVAGTVFGLATVLMFFTVILLFHSASVGGTPYVVGTYIFAGAEILVAFTLVMFLVNGRVISVPRGLAGVLSAVIAVLALVLATRSNLRSDLPMNAILSWLPFQTVVYTISASLYYMIMSNTHGKAFLRLFPRWAKIGVFVVLMLFIVEIEVSVPTFG
jgi:hypothetical protein